MTQRSSYPWVEVLFVAALLLGGCGPETLPEGLSSKSQVQPPSNRQPAASNTVVASTPTLPVPDTSTPLTPTAGIAQPSPTVAVTTTRSAEIASPIVPSLAITDPAKVDVFQIAEELVEAGDAAFPIQATLGTGEDAMQIKASMPSSIQFPCYPNASAPRGDQYTCRIGGGMESHLWIAAWGQGLQRLLTDQSMGATAWSPDSNRVAFATLAGQDERKNVPLKILDLESDEEIIVGMMSSPFQVVFTDNDELIYLYEGALHVVSVPREQSLAEGISLVKTIPLRDIPDNDAYFEPEGPIAWINVSPRGDKVAILRATGDHESGELSILDLGSEQEYVIDEQLRNLSYAAPFMYAWSPQEDTLAYMTLRTTVEGKPGEEIYAHQSQLWLISADGGNRRLLWEADQPNRSYTDIEWLPNGKAILIAASMEAWSDLVQIVSVKDGQHQDLFTSGKWGSLISLVPGQALALMPNVISHEPAVYDIAVLIYSTQ